LLICSSPLLHETACSEFRDTLAEFSIFALVFSKRVVGCVLCHPNEMILARGDL